ncbi:sigma-54 interaction domain-containing protein [Caldanaerobacter subterraneus]|uniref:Transcriptional regulator n=1 Tax=Caldanaerobacter subterraneus subsp. pacificus DSM 12653 TaxID=391606 RepID=A0A0F5PNY6_9THEO|nr:sigma 54-interacting transcriptional regulator [Caldanaerobacter subterraneus]KKC30382.1 transcriptional regulator [Caldanaerobacter subterraneus subsp. pacificus DSM 12653]
MSKNIDKSFLFSEEMEFLFESVFDKLPIAIDILDAEGNIRMINKTFFYYLGLEKDKVINKYVLDVDRNSRFPLVLKTGQNEIAYRHKFANGKEAIVHRIAIKDGDEVIGGFGMILFEDLNELRKLIEKNRLLETELEHYKKTLRKIHGAKYSWENIIGKSDAIVECKKKAMKMANMDSNILIYGESGVGKELFAHAIHNSSKRRDYPFVTVNCAAIPEQLMESELFGYEEGAFTGAQKGGKIGKFELANHGTIFLDEIGDMPYTMQAKLLRVLQEGEIERVGGKAPIKVDVRVISATNKDLSKLVKEGKFRSDLFYRINVLMLNVPPLRERKEDIPLLIDHFLSLLTQNSGIYKKVSKEVYDILEKYDWPGNIRELRNVIERMVVNSEGDIIRKTDIPLYILKKELPVRKKGSGLQEMLEEFEKEIIFETLKECNYNKSQAAEILKIPRSRLYRKLKKFGILEENNEVK